MLYQYLQIFCCYHYKQTPMTGVYFKLCFDIVQIAHHLATDKQVDHTYIDTYKD